MTASRTVCLCPVCGAVAPGYGAGPDGRPGARCLQCGSLERHRVAAPLLRRLVPAMPAGLRVLDVSSVPAVARLLREQAGRRYVSIDVDPASDGEGGLTALPLPSAGVGLLFCSHVLQGVPDDAAAMREIARVLHPDGVGVLQVPRRHGTSTDEDPAAGPAERTRRFGRAENVRYYGDDIEQRLQAAGLAVRRVTSADLLPPFLRGPFGVLADEELWLVSPGEIGEPVDRALAGLNEDDVAGEVLAAAGRARAQREQEPVHRLAEQLRAQLAVVQAEARRWERSYRGLTARPLVRTDIAVRRRVRAWRSARGSGAEG